MCRNQSQHVIETDPETRQKSIDAALFDKTMHEWVLEVCEEKFKRETGKKKELESEQKNGSYSYGFSKGI
jgi:carbamoylphosphate synthase large subunit